MAFNTEPFFINMSWKVNLANPMFAKTVLDWNSDSGLNCEAEAGDYSRWYGTKWTGFVISIISINYQNWFVAFESVTNIGALAFKFYLSTPVLFFFIDFLKWKIIAILPYKRWHQSRQVMLNKMPTRGTALESGQLVILLLVVVF